MTICALLDERHPVHVVHLPCGETVKVRPARPQDTDSIQAYIRILSPASRRNRFLGAVNVVSANELYRITHTDRGSYPVLIAESVIEGACKMIGEVRYAVAPDWFNCEFAVSVAEAWRRKALGTLLVGIIASRAKALGLRYLVGDVFHSNQAMIALARKSGFAVTEPIADARLVKITKDLLSWMPHIHGMMLHSLVDRSQPDEQSSAMNKLPTIKADFLEAGSGTRSCLYIPACLALANENAGTVG